MKVVIQRCKYASVSVDSKLINEIDQGLAILVGFHVNDTIDDLNYIVKKIINLRIFDDENKVMNKSILDIITKYSESTSKVNRSIIKSVTNCGCININATKQDINLSKSSLNDLSANI